MIVSHPLQKKIILNALFVLLVGGIIFAFIGIFPVKALEIPEYVSFIQPPNSKVSVQVDAERSNILESGESGKMSFLQAGEKLIIPPGQSGVQLQSSQFEADVSPETVLFFHHRLELIQGSLHIVAGQKNSIDLEEDQKEVVQDKDDKIDDQNEEFENQKEHLLKMAGLELKFSQASLLTFVSGDGKERIVKVISGEVTVTNTQSNQTLTLTSLQATEADGNGRLLLPYAFEVPPEPWWESDDYQYSYVVLPTAHAGHDQRVLGNVGVTLDGSQSRYKTGDIFEWTLLNGPRDENNRVVEEVAFDSTNIVKPVFTPIEEGLYQFSLQIFDEEGRGSNRDTVSIFVGEEYLKPVEVFSDVPLDHPHNLAIFYIRESGIMKGSKDQKSGQILFRPDESLNRAEILKTLIDQKQIPLLAKEDLLQREGYRFDDVKDTHWFAPYVYAALERKFITDKQALFRPADPVQLDEAIKIITQVNQISLESFAEKPGLPYKDAKTGAWNLAELFFAKEYNLLDPNDQGEINPARALTRGEFAEILFRMDSVNLLEKRGTIDGIIVDESNGEPIAGADVLVYKADYRPSELDTGTPIIEKGQLFYKTVSDENGFFHFSLPALSKYYLEALSADAISSQRIIVEVAEGETESIELTVTSP